MSRRKDVARDISEQRVNEQVIALLESITLGPQVCPVALENIARWLSKGAQETEQAYEQLHRALESREARSSPC